jgi:two-component system chemotaxis response regulator CheB
VIGIVLSGILDDGTAGMIAIKERGGVAIAQDPQDALYPGMPLSAIENAGVDFVLPLSDIAPLLTRLVQQEVEEERSQPVSDEMDVEADIAEMDAEALRKERRPGTPSRFTCPECNGVLWELDEQELLRFRCRVGHAYSAESLLAEQFDVVEAAMWAALRALEENISLARQVAMRMRNLGHDLSAERFEQQAEEGEREAELLRRVLTVRSPADPAEADPVASQSEAIAESVSVAE